MKPYYKISWNGFSPAMPLNHCPCVKYCQLTESARVQNFQGARTVFIRCCVFITEKSEGQQETDDRNRFLAEKKPQAPEFQAGLASQVPTYLGYVGTCLLCYTPFCSLCYMRIVVAFFTIGLIMYDVLFYACLSGKREGKAGPREADQAARLELEP